MRHAFLLILTVLIAPVSCNSQDLKIYYEKTQNGYMVFADNYSYCPMSVKLDLEVTNLNGSRKSKIHVIQPRKNHQLLANLVVAEKGKPYKFSYKYRFNLGNHYLKTYDEDHVYDLPFQTDSTYRIWQGYNGNFSHQDKNALDFTMPIGTEIRAIRQGTVVKVVENNTFRCEKPECIKFNNVIIIYHEDGTFASYIHLKPEGALVEEGDKVERGQLIGYSGNTGYSTGPHLHLEVFIQRLENRETLQTKFRTGDGSTIEYLAEKNFYERNYE